MDKFGIERLGSENYESWSFQLKSLLMREELYKYVTKDAPNPLTEAWTNGDAKAQGTISLFVGITQQSLIRKCTTAKQIWETLRDHHQKTSLTSKVSILKRICNLTYSNGDDMERHLHEMEDLFQRLTNAGLELGATLSVVLILRSLPPSYEALTTALESRPEADLTMDVVKRKLLDEALKRSERSGRGESLLRVDAGSKPIICHQCQKPGHMKKDCRSSSKKNDAKQKDVARQPKHKARVATEGDVVSPFAFAANPRPTAHRSKKNWIVDSGASSHMCSDEAFFHELKPISGMSVTLADGRVADVAGKGSGNLFCKDDKGKKQEIILSNVLLVPELDTNLVSVGQLTDKGALVKFDTSKCVIEHNEHVAAVATKRGGLYHLNVCHHDLKTASTNHTKNCLHDWHRKLGHRDIDAIQRLVREGLATGVCVRECGISATCECCLEGKMARLPFPKQAGPQSTKVLDLVHTDICGPMNTVTPGGARYFMVMIDDYSRFTVVYFLKRKSEAAERIEDYVEMVHTRFGRYPTAIRSDQGGEYKSKRLGRFYRSKGITPQFTTAYTPQQNGVAERKNRSLVEMGRCMLLDGELGYRYWAEAVNTAAYLQNLLPTRSTDKTPFEAWYGKKPNLDHLRVFGAQAYVHIPSEKRTKLEPKAVKMTFVGYSDQHKAYRFIDPSDDKVVYSRDARFLENERAPKKSSKPIEVIEIESPLSLDQPEGEEEDDDEEVSDSSSEYESGVSDSSSEYESGVSSPDEASGESPDESSEGSLDETSEETSDEEAIPIPTPEVIPTRRSERSTKGIPPLRYRETTSLVQNFPPEPRTYDEAINGPESALWKAAIEEELQSLRANHTWDVTDLPQGRKVVGSKWIFKRKLDERGDIVRYKARLVAQGFTQKYGTDFDEVFAPVVKQVTFRVLLSVASQRKMVVKHADVKTAYLHGTLEETVYMRPPPGSIVGDGKVCLLRKSLYGLKQAARVWNQTFDAVLKSLGFEQSKNDSCLYIRRTGNKRTYLVVYVDDLVIACEEEEEYEQIIRELNQHFEVTSLGDIRHFLGIEVNRSAGGVSLNQATYIRKLLDRFGMTDAKPSKFPLSPGHTQSKEENGSDKLPNNHQYASLIGGLLYVAVNTRPDISAAVSILGRKTSCPTQADWLEAKRVLRYLKQTLHDELVLGVDGSSLKIYVDADWAGDSSDRKSTSGFVFRFAGGSVSWSSKKQTCVTLSSTEAEYVALAECCQEFRWVRRILIDFDVQLSSPVVVFEDNQGVIKQAKSPTVGRRSKHIETKFHFVRELQQNGEIDLRYCPTDVMIADMMTKPLQSVKLKGFREAAGILPSRRSVGDNDSE